MSKKKFEYMSSNEWLGDMTTHFMKSGEALRSLANKELETISAHVPKIANGVKVEYDISYDIKGKIHGYKFSDFLTKALYICPQSFYLAKTIIAHSADMPVTAEGKRVVEQLRQGIEDKYILSDDVEISAHDLVVLPGTNLLSKENVIDMNKIDDLVADGAYVKLHPITERTWVNFLKNRWGKNVISEDAALYPLMRRATKIWFPMSSETGISALLLGKKLGSINHPEKTNSSSFEHIYAGLSQSKNGTLLNRLTAALSNPESGLITTYHDDPAARIAAFFEYTKQYPHK